MRPAKLLVAALLLSGPLLRTARAADALSAADRSFATGVNQGGMFEVKAGQLAADQGSTPLIRDQGTTEAHDHGLVGEKLRSIIGDTDLSLPSDLDDTFGKELADLKAKSGAAFDAAYLKDMEQVHSKDGAAFAREARNGSNPRLKAFAAETHGIVEAHIGELRAISTTKH